MHNLVRGMGIFLFLVSAVAQAESGRFLVKLRSDSGAPAPAEFFARSGLKVVKHIPELGIHVVEPVTNGRFSTNALHLLQQSEAVVYAERDAEIRAFEETPVSARTMPDDPLYPEQQQMRRMNVSLAWDRSTGSKDVVVAVVDTGVALDHPDLMHNLWTNQAEIPDNGIDDDGNGYVDDVHGWNFAANNNDTTDEASHGTHVAGIVGAEGNNAEGVAGVNWHVTLMPVKFMDSRGRGSVETAIQALLYAVRNGARIINASWGSTEASQALRDAAEYAYQQGALVVSAAGNEMSDNDLTPTYPASFDTPAILSVASSQRDGALSSFSNYGDSSVDLAAPGSAILSTLPGGRYDRNSGTSMAAPMVTGVGALILSLRPQLSPLELRNALLNAVRERSSYSGWLATQGDIDASLALRQLDQGFQVWPARLTLPLGSPYPFTVFGGEGPVEWSVSDESVASIDQAGNLVLHQDGEVQVIARDARKRQATTTWVRSSGRYKAPRPMVPTVPRPHGEQATTAILLVFPSVLSVLAAHRERFQQRRRQERRRQRPRRRRKVAEGA